MYKITNQPAFITANNLIRTSAGNSCINTEGIASLKHDDTDNCFYVRLLGDRYSCYEVCKKDHPESYDKLKTIPIVK